MTEIALAVVHDRIADRVLLVKRSGSSDLTGWAFPGGKVEAVDRKQGPAATICHAARRELAEETGLVAEGCGTPLLTRTHPTTGVVVSYVYFSERDLGGFPARPKRMEPEKADQCRWMPRERVSELFGEGSSTPVLRKMAIEARRAKKIPRCSKVLMQPAV